jgi:hypothetical protein
MAANRLANQMTIEEQLTRQSLEKDLLSPSARR